MSEQLSVSVDRDFARFGSKSYAINKINSVDVRSHRPYGAVGSALGGIITLFLVLAIVGQASNQNPSASALINLVFLALGAAAFTWWSHKRSKIVEYKLYLTTSSQEAQAFVSRNRDEVMGLRSEIERAMARQ